MLYKLTNLFCCVGVALSVAHATPNDKEEEINIEQLKAVPFKKSKNQFIHPLLTELSERAGHLAGYFLINCKKNQDKLEDLNKEIQSTHPLDYQEKYKQFDQLQDLEEKKKYNLLKDDDPLVALLKELNIEEEPDTSNRQQLETHYKDYIQLCYKRDQFETASLHTYESFKSISNLGQFINKMLFLLESYGIFKLEMNNLSSFQQPYTFNNVITKTICNHFDAEINYYTINTNLLESMQSDMNNASSQEQVNTKLKQAKSTVEKLFIDLGNVDLEYIENCLSEEVGKAQIELKSIESLVCHCDMEHYLSNKVGKAQIEPKTRDSLMALGIIFKNKLTDVTFEFSKNKKQIWDPFYYILNLSGEIIEAFINQKQQELKAHASL